MNEIEFLRQRINDYAIFRKKPDDPYLPGKDGGVYSWQFYLQRVLLDSEFLKSVSILALEEIYDLWKKEPFQLGAVESSGVPLALGMTLYAPYVGMNDLNMITIRKEPKSYGLCNAIEGIPKDLPVLLVDDMCNSKNSLFNAYIGCLEHDLKVMNTGFTLINKLERDEAQYVEEDKYFSEINHTLNMRTLFYIDDFELDYTKYQEDYHAMYGEYPKDQYRYDPSEKLMIVEKMS